MVGARFGRWSLAIGGVVLGFAVYATPAAAQSGVKGRVVDAQSKPVEGAKVMIVQTDNQSRKYEVTTNKKGEFIQVGVPAGDYSVTAQKGDLAQRFAIHVGLDIKEVNFTLKPGAAGASAEDVAKEAKRIEGIKVKFAEGATLSNEGKYDEAIAKFAEVLVDVPKCAECWANIGAVYAQKKDYEKSEESYKKALEMNPDSADAYNGLATIYNSQKRFEDAEKASAEAAKRLAGPEGAAGGAGNPEAFYNQGVIAWNGNNFAKAQEHFGNAIKAKPDHAESHFMLGKVYLNLGKLPEAAGEFQTYLKIAPSGPNAKEAQTTVDQLKSFIK